MKTKISLLICILLAALFLSAVNSFGQALSGSSQKTGTTVALNSITIDGDASISGTLDVTGGTFFLGSWEGNSERPGISINYVDSDTAASSQLNWTATRAAHTWLWERGNGTQDGYIPMMKLDENHILTIYDTAGNAAIVLDPNQTSANGLSVEQSGTLSEQSSLTREERLEAWLESVLSGSDGELKSLLLSGLDSTLASQFASGGQITLASILASDTRLGGHLSGILRASGSGAYSTALGYETVASGDYSTAMGAWTVAEGEYSTAMGYYTTASNQYDIAMGHFSTASGGGAVAIGGGATASGNLSVALGYLTNASAGVSTAMGYTTTASGWGSTAMGAWNTTASGYVSTAIGSGVTASGVGSTAMGGDTHAAGYASTAMGAYTTASGGYSTAMGVQTVASGGYSTAMGRETTAIGESSIAMGAYTTATGAVSTAMGGYTKATADFATAMGAGPTASGWASTAMGHDTTASGYCSTAMGYQTIASGDYGAVAMGENTTASGHNSFAMGFMTTASGGRSFAMGENTTAQAYASTVLGRWNIVRGNSGSWDAADDLFVVGNGTITPSNAFVVQKNGDTTTYGNFNVSTQDGSYTSNSPGYTLFVKRGTGALPSMITQQSTQPNMQWNWQRTVAGGNSASAMTLDTSNRLILTGTATSNPPQLILDPNEGLTYGNSPILTQTAADARYIVNHAAGYNTVFPSVAMGLNTTASGDASTAMGYETKATGNGASTAMGHSTTASGDSSTAMGGWTTASGDFSTAMGGDAVASGYASTAMGHGSIASGSVSMAIGLSSTASGEYSNAQGFYTTASGNYSTAMGSYTLAAGHCSTALGYVSVASGSFSTAMGEMTIASGYASTAMGRETIAQAYASTVLGGFNVVQGSSNSWIATDDLFVIGNGTNASNPSNAFVVQKNGDTTVYGTLTISSTNGSTATTPSSLKISHDETIQRTNLTGAISITGEAQELSSGTTVVAPAGQAVLIVPQQGDLLMGDFTQGEEPL